MMSTLYLLSNQYNSNIYHMITRIVNKKLYIKGTWNVFNGKMVIWIINRKKDNQQSNTFKRFNTDVIN